MGKLEDKGLEEQVFSVVELAPVFGISEWKLRNAIKDLHIPKTGNRHVNGYKLGRVAQALLEDARGKAKPEEPKPPTLKEQKEQLQLDEMREQAALRRREIVPVALLEEYASQVANVTRSGLESLTANIYKQIPHLRPDELQSIRKEISAIADRIADFEVDPASDEGAA